jgi:CheY-like chemotaxis protein
MDVETQHRIFEPFYTTKFTGRGLGMSSVMGIIKSHNGAILLYSEPGLGSTFKVLLPVCSGLLNRAEAAEGVNTLPMPRGDSVGKVLVVDDEELVQEVCREYLHDLGLGTLGAMNGSEAAEVFRRNCDDVSLVILDLTMPHMDGVAALHALRQIRPDIKVLISSGHATQATEKMFIDDVPDGFIQKPFQFQELQDKIVAILNNPSGQCS